MASMNPSRPSYWAPGIILATLIAVWSGLGVHLVLQAPFASGTDESINYVALAASPAAGRAAVARGRPGAFHLVTSAGCAPECLPRRPPPPYHWSWPVEFMYVVAPAGSGGSAPAFRDGHPSGYSLCLAAVYARP